MGALAFQITSLTIVYSTVYSGANRRKHQSSVLLAFVRGIQRWPVHSPHKGPVTRKMFPFDDVIMCYNFHVIFPHFNVSTVTASYIFPQIAFVLHQIMCPSIYPIYNFESLSRTWNQIIMGGLWKIGMSVGILVPSWSKPSTTWQFLWHNISRTYYKFCKVITTNLNPVDYNWTVGTLCMF